ncbi:MAG TPA: branched-chain amino acid ABC transporter permease [Candidatus Limnocylindrales bacterium]|jgi:branched-chain amino acid transport system permease protein|nr:branched-chain amino acid ABC transporter permease [Candidatus Limnocylindrales bacterium]
MSTVDFLNLLVSAFLLAGVYAAMSVGMTVIYGVMKIVNLAHAGFLMLGAYFVYVLFERFHLDPLIGVVLAFPAFYFFGIAIHWLLVRRIPRSDVPTTTSLLLLFGLWLVLQNLGYLIWGNADRSILTSRTFSTIQVGPLIFPTVRLVVFGAAVVSLVALEVLLHRTWFGRSVRALMQNSESGQLVGVNVEKTARVAFGVGVAFAGAAGGLLAMMYSFTPDFGGSFLLRAFVIIVLGGLESFGGVAIGALVLALVETFSILVIPSGYQPAISFSLLVLALVILPGGVAGLWNRRHRLT